MSTLTRAEATRILKDLGWRIRSDAEYVTCVKNFQAGWNLGPALAVDGKVGPATSAAMRTSAERKAKGRSTASEHFSFSEVRCRCEGRYSTCQRIWFKRKAFEMLEKYRAKTGAPLDIFSACRCTKHNAAVGGSPTSRHLTGLANDVRPRYSPRTVKGWGIATHIGYSPSLNRVIHIDMGSGRTVSDPAVYTDGK